ncbi:hypothetical protein FA95DRAFT_1555921 [Auriscalpium vulgare]|uniref:Uncharacterized protein n=1 Tax=Auriscalpium vulgare TaxID=40419 RepID=A0ACB8S313_9AGAM|nr:hypothetical protein FA95DRAFT_1555921 [Auriscalpium vulgare]
MLLGSTVSPEFYLSRTKLSVNHWTSLWLRARVDKSRMDEQRSLLVRRAEHNNALPVHRLPPELLSRIMALCAAERLASWPESVGELRWIAVTHVCRHWRTVALAHGGLWAGDVTFRRGVAWFHESVRRACRVPLCIDTVDAEDEATFELVATHLAATKELRIGALAFDEPPRARRLLTAELPAPLLDTLTVHGLFSACLPLSGLGSCAPNLRRVEVLTHCPDLPWTSGLLKNLTVLDVQSRRWQLEEEELHWAAMDDVLAALNRMPNLEKLRIVGLPPTGSATPGESIPLLRLTELTLNAAAVPCMTLLRRIVAPSCTTVRLSLSCDTADEALAAFDVVAAWLKAHWHKPLREVKLMTANCSSRILHAEAWGHGRIDNAAAILDFAWEEEVDTKFLKRMAVACYRALQTGLEELSMDLDCWDRAAWLDVVGGHMGLRRVVAIGAAADAFVDAFNADEGAPSTKQDSFLPLLSSVDLPYTRFYNEQVTASPSNEMASTPLEPRYPSLQKILAARAEAGCPAATLSFSDAHVQFDHVLARSHG